MTGEHTLPLPAGAPFIEVEKDVILYTNDLNSLSYNVLCENLPTFLGYELSIALGEQKQLLSQVCLKFVIYFPYLSISMHVYSLACLSCCVSSFRLFIYSARNQCQSLVKAQHRSRQNNPHHCPASRCWRHQPLCVLHGGTLLQGSSSVLEEFFNWFGMDSNCRIVGIDSAYTTTLLLPVITLKYI